MRNREIMVFLARSLRIYWVFHTNGRFNLRKTNAANEGWLADSRTDAGSKLAVARPIATSF